ncbi:uncharacterized protein LOC114328165 [Diabrotica virgifera virgifera]|uniref:Bromo domain-containing protein n=1 Tax=Diabrotica virgifera virgifera TaxID=50390 RepID=A0ABM5IHA4_DIAVI|nr:uncharacterized protein LOC114328165 [Diabrotica virgifera virgifera]
MEQNRPENTTSQQQNVHLHMHHMCNCPGNVYPTYYPAVGYRSPAVPSLVTYQPPPVSRQFLQHYQYTQYNVGNQYSVPISHVASNTPIYNTTSVTSTDVVFGGVARDQQRGKGGSQEDNGDVERTNDSSTFDYSQITSPASELLLTENSETTTPENFVKFLERSCLIAEQIAYRNKNRPCFRNIQNLCIRTRSEILKPCTTISNIHSQGIPWATKDFIYAFVRLTNCWHILKGYWENRDGSSLGKIEKELTPEFRACYVRWEKETMELASQLTRVFYNLDTNLVTPQVNLVKNSTPENVDKKNATIHNVTTSTLTNISINNSRSNTVRGIIRLPTISTTETVDQANQTYSADFCTAKEGFDLKEERRVYMKPGSYNVPKRDGTDGGTISTPRAIEFLETAQNINKGQANNDRYWTNINVVGSKKSEEAKVQEDVTSDSELELDLSTHLNVHEWLISNNFSDVSELSPTSTATQDLRAFFVDASTLYESLPQLDTNLQKSSSIKVLQRGKNALRKERDIQINGLTGISEETTRKLNKTPAKKNIVIYENESGITNTGVTVLNNLVLELKKYDILEGLDIDDRNYFCPVVDIDKIFNKMKHEGYVYVNEVVRDLRYLINYYISFAEKFANVDNKKKELVTFITNMFSLKLRDTLEEQFMDYDFSDITGDILQYVGPLKLKTIKFKDEDQVYK